MIQENAEIAKDAEYSYWGAKEGYAYDTTLYNDDVLVYNNSEGYDKYGNWTWIESPRSDAYSVSNTKKINKTIELYNACIVTYGYCELYSPD